MSNDVKCFDLLYFMRVLINILVIKTYNVNFILLCYNKKIYCFYLTSLELYDIMFKYLRVCWNRQTGTFEGRVSKDVWVQVPLLAPKYGQMAELV